MQRNDDNLGLAALFYHENAIFKNGKILATLGKNFLYVISTSCDENTSIRLDLAFPRTLTFD